MPRGFIGRPANAYLGRASEAHTRAVDTGKSIASAAPSNALLRERRLPFEPIEGTRGGMVSTGRGTSSNIAVSLQEYDRIMRTISQADDTIGQCVYNISCEIETLCQTAFILPAAVPRCLNISEQVKRSLGEFRTVTEEAMIAMGNFARDITNIG